MKYPRILLTFILAAVVTLWSVPVGAVLTEHKVVGPKGEPVPNTEITIFDEKGKEVGKKKTDDKGVLVFDFPGKGKYDLKWPGGTQTMEVPGFWTPATMAIAGGLGLAAATGVAISGGGSGGGGAPPSGSTVPDRAEIPGSYSFVGTESSDPCNIGSSTLSHPGVPFTATNGMVNIHSSATMTGPYNSSTGSYSGSGTHGHLKETFNGTFMKNGAVTARGNLSFEYLSGPNAGCVVNYNATYTKQ